MVHGNILNKDITSHIEIRMLPSPAAHMSVIVVPASSIGESLV